MPKANTKTVAEEVVLDTSVETVEEMNEEKKKNPQNPKFQSMKKSTRDKPLQFPFYTHQNQAI